MSKYRVLRKFNSNRPHEIGEEIELVGPHIGKLVEQRYLALIEDSAPKSAPVVKRPRGRPKKVTNV